MPGQDKRLIYRLEAENGKLLQKLQQAEKRLDRYRSRVSRVNQQIQHSFDRVGRHVGTALAGIGAAASLRGIVKAADTYSLLRSRLKLVTDSEEQLIDVEKKLFNLAQATRSGYEETTKLYTRTAQAAKTLGLSQEQVLRLTESTNKALQIGGASTREAAAATLQFSQAIGSGKLGGEELRSVLENAPRLAQAIAEGLEVTTGQLLKLRDAGLLTAENFTKALSKQSKVLDAEFLKLERTVGQAVAQLQNEFQRALAGVDTGPLIESIDQLKEVISDPETIQAVVALASGIVKAFSAATKAIAGTVKVVQFLGEETAAVFKGINENDTARLEQDLEKIKSLLSKDSLLGGIGERIRFFGQGGIIEYWSDEELRSEKARIEAALAKTYDDLGRQFRDRQLLSAPKKKEETDTGPVLKGTPEQLKLVGQFAEKALTPLQKLEKELQTLNELRLDDQLKDLITPEVFEANKKRIEDSIAKLNEASPAVKQLNDQLTDFQSQLDAVKTPQEQFNEKQEIAEKLLAARKISQEEYNTALQLYTKELNASDQGLQNLLSTLESLKTPQDIFNEQQAEADRLLAQGKISSIEYGNAIFAYTQQLNEATGANDQWKQDLADSAHFAELAVTPLQNLQMELARLQELQEKQLISPEVFESNKSDIENQMRQLDEFGGFIEDFAGNIHGALTDFLVDPINNDFNDLADNFARTLQRMAAEAAASKILDTVLGTGGSGGGLFAGFFDSGGNIGPGQFGIVGERGPELVKGPANIVGREDTAGMMGGINIGTINFPSVNDESTARKAAGAFARQMNSILVQGQRYN